MPNLFFTFHYCNLAFEVIVINLYILRLRVLYHPFMHSLMNTPIAMKLTPSYSLCSSKNHGLLYDMVMAAMEKWLNTRNASRRYDKPSQQNGAVNFGSKRVPWGQGLTCKQVFLCVLYWRSLLGVLKKCFCSKMFRWAIEKNSFIRWRRDHHR